MKFHVQDSNAACSGVTDYKVLRETEKKIWQQGLRLFSEDKL